MRHVIRYQCGDCGLEFRSRDEAMDHESSHYGVTPGDYREWLRLRQAAARAGRRAGIRKCPETDAAFDGACRALADFEAARRLSGRTQPIQV